MARPVENKEDTRLYILLGQRIEPLLTDPEFLESSSMAYIWPINGHIIEKTVIVR